MARRRWLLFVATICIVALVAAACSSDGAGEGAVAKQAGGSADTTLPTEAAPAPTPTTEMATTSVTGPSWCESGPFTIDEQRGAIVGPDGVDFLPVGINLTTGAYQDGAFWEKTSVTDMTAADVAVLRDVWGFTAVRLNIDSNQRPDIWDDAELDRVIGLFVDAGLVAIVENHPFGTGLDPTAEQIAETAEGFASIARRWAGNGCVWFNPYNEPGGRRFESVYEINRSDVTLDDAWVDWHVPVIEAIRAESDAVIVLDDTHFGQGRAGGDFEADESAILSYGSRLNADHEGLLYSVHFYDRWGGDTGLLTAFLDEAQRQGLAVVVGEVGGHPAEGPYFTDGYWETAEALFGLRRAGVGILLWHGRTGHQSGMSVSRDQGRRVAVWEITDRADTEASGTLLWDWAQDPPAATP